MIIKSTFEALSNAMATVSSIFADKNVQEDMKNVVIWAKEDGVFFAAYNGKIASLTKVEAEVAPEEGQPDTSIFQLTARDINDVLNSLRGLQRTRVSSIEFAVSENEAIMNVYEEPLDADSVHANDFKVPSAFRVAKPRLKDVIKDEIMKIDASFEGTVVPSVDLMVYINALLPTVAKETREGTSSVMFGTEHIYTVPGAYSAIMPNKLPEVLQGFRLVNSAVSFVKNFISMGESFEIVRQEMGNGMITLTLRVGNSVAMIRCPDMSRAFDITNFVGQPPNGVVVDKAYLVDVLKRMSLNSEASLVDITINATENGSVGSFQITSKTFRQSLPVFRAKGEGSFRFSIKSDLLSAMIFSHANFSSQDETVFLYFEINEKGSITMACTDNNMVWQTKMLGVSVARQEMAWS